MTKYAAIKLISHAKGNKIIDSLQSLALLNVSCLMIPANSLGILLFNKAVLNLSYCLRSKTSSTANTNAVNPSVSPKNGISPLGALVHPCCLYAGIVSGVVKKSIFFSMCANLSVSLKRY